MRLKTASETLRKILLGLGGYAAGGEDFSRLVRSQEAIQKLARNLTAYLRLHDLDGVQIDWQYPTMQERGGKLADRGGYTALLRVSSEFVCVSKHNIILSSCSTSSSIAHMALIIWSGLHLFCLLVAVFFYIDLKVIFIFVSLDR